MRSSALRIAVLSLGFLPALIVSGSSSATTVVVRDQPSTEARCREARRVLDDLTDAPIAEVWEIVEAGGLPDFDSIGDVGDETFAECRTVLLGKLTKVLSRTDDDRVVARILEEIDFEDAAPLLPALRKALRHSSPEVRRHALRAVAVAEDPTLAGEVEARFEVELDERVRRELIRALAATESRRFLAALRDLARADDERLGHVALQAVMSLPDASSVPFLAEFASSPPEGDEDLAGDIASALAAWSDVPGTVEALLRIGSDGPEAAFPAAIAGLSARGVDSLGALVVIASARERAGETALAKFVGNAISWLQDRIEGESETITLSCGGDGKPSRGLPLASGYEEDAPSMIVTPADGSESARCWDAPGFMWPGEIRPRVPAGAELMTFDEFFWDAERWLASISVEHICWMREADLSVGGERRGATDDVAAYEFDLSIADAHSWAVGTLERRGWLSSLSVDESVATFRLAMGRPDRQSVAALIDIRRRTDASGVNAAIDQWLWRHASAWSADDELGSGIPKHDPRWNDVEEGEDE